MIKLRIGYSGHYPEKVVEVSAEELQFIKDLEKEYGEIEAAPNSDRLGEILQREPVEDEVYTICAYA